MTRQVRHIIPPMPLIRSLERRSSSYLGGIDTLVPWATSQEFLEKLQVGKSGVKKVVVVPDAGHECTAVMVAEAAQFIEMEALKIRKGEM